MGNWTCRSISRATGAALVGAIVVDAAVPQTYNAGQDAARRAAEQAAQAAARSGAAQLEADRLRSQREAESQRRQQSSTYTPSHSPGQSGSTSSGSGGSGGVDMSSYYARSAKISAYQSSVSMNPPAGAGSLGDWQYEVRHDAGGKYVFGTATTVAIDPRNGLRVRLTLACDLRSRVAEERNGKVYGPMAIEVDHAEVTNGRRPSGIALGEKNSSFFMEWELGGEITRTREQRYKSLASNFFPTVVDGGLRIGIVEGGGVDRQGNRNFGQVKAEAIVSDDGYAKAFAKVAPCWSANWFDWPVVKSSPAVAPAAAPAPALTPAPARAPAPAPAPARAPAPAPAPATATAAATPSQGFMVAPLRPAPPPSLPVPAAATGTLPPEEMEKVPALLARLAKPSTVYCSEGICLGDHAAKVLQYQWDSDLGYDFMAKLREAESAGQHCRPKRELLGKRIRPDGRRQVVRINYRPGPSPTYVRRIEIVSPAPLNDQQRVEILEKGKDSWPGLAGDIKGSESRLQDSAAGVTFYLVRSWFDYADSGLREHRVDGAVSVMQLETSIRTLHYMLASQSGCPPGIYSRN